MNFATSLLIFSVLWAAAALGAVNHLRQRNWREYANKHEIYWI